MGAISSIFILFLIGGAGGDSLSVTSMASFSSMDACVAAATTIDAALKTGQSGAAVVCLDAGDIEALSKRAAGPKTAK